MGGLYKQEAQEGKKYVLTEKGYEKTLDHVKHERKIGEPVKGYETSVPVTWIQKGYVVEN